MSIEVVAQIGATGPRVSLPPRLALPPNSFDAVHTWAGSYDVLEVPGHFDAYHLQARTPIHLYPVAPPCGYFAPLKHKLESGEINGNFGETLPAIFAFERLGLGPDRVIHLTRTAANGKSPDFLFSLGESLATNSIWPPLALPTGLPTWWPVECKATRGKISAQWTKALKQLSQFWYDERKNPDLEPGYGIVSIFDHSTTPRTLLWRFVLPRAGQEANLKTALVAATSLAEADAAIRPLLRA